MDTYVERHRRCPYCFAEFKTGEWSDEVEFTCRGCGNDFTLGEAKRGRPDVAKTSEVAALTERVAVLESRIARLERAMSHLVRIEVDGGEVA